MDWIVKIKTQSGYVKDVIVYDYNYPQDAVDAALAQTGAKSYVNYSPYFKSNSTQDTSSSNSSYNYTIRSSGSSSKDLEFIFWLCLGLITVIVFPPLGVVIFGVMVVRLNKKN
jgi:hypothetical protein